MVPILPLLLLMGLSVCAVAGDGGEELTLGTEAGSWVTVNLQVGAVASIQLQLHEVKRGKASQFFGLMGKRVRDDPDDVFGSWLWPGQSVEGICRVNPADERNTSNSAMENNWVSDGTNGSGLTGQERIIQERAPDIPIGKVLDRALSFGYAPIVEVSANE